MEIWISPALVAAGILINIILGLRREAKHAGISDTIQAGHEKRLNAHGLELDGVKERLGYHGERIASLESWREGTERR